MQTLLIGVAPRRRADALRTLSRHRTEVHDGGRGAVHTAGAVYLPHVGVIIARPTTPDQHARIEEAVWSNPAALPLLTPISSVTALPVLVQHAPDVGAGEGRRSLTLPWHLEAIGVSLRSRATEGTGVTVGILDTGVASSHPALHAARGRIRCSSFVSGEVADTDKNGHGTHVTSCVGIGATHVTRRFGVAPGATLVHAQVMAQNGQGDDAAILRGIDHLVEQGASVICAALGRDTAGESSPLYEHVADSLLDRGVVICAAAGNTGNATPVATPANCPSVVAVGAMTRDGGIATFSPGLLDSPNGVALVAPGVDVDGLWPWLARGRMGHAHLSGTSAACSIVAGIMAAYASHTGLRGRALLRHAFDRAWPIPGAPRHLQGHGLSRLILD